MTTPTPAPPAQPAAAGRKTAGGAPILPIALIVAGSYLAWFGVKYWRSDVAWPSDPVKAVLQGKPIPPASRTGETQDVQSISTLFGSASVSVSGSLSGAAGIVGRSIIATDAQKYVGAGYVFGGNASRIGDWDCSSFVSYVLGHDMGLPLPGGHWGDPGFPPHAHGPVASTYALYGSPINRGDVSAGDLVAWNTHVGIAIDGSRLVAARTPTSGTGISNIDATTASLGETAHYRRVPLPAASQQTGPAGQQQIGAVG